MTLSPNSTPGIAISTDPVARIIAFASWVSEPTLTLPSPAGLVLLDDRGLLAELCRSDRRHVASRPSADHDDVVGSHRPERIREGLWGGRRLPGQSRVGEAQSRGSRLGIWIRAIARTM